MSFPLHVKALAHALDPECWVSYAGRCVADKRVIEARRQDALARAERIIRSDTAGCSPPAPASTPAQVEQEAWVGINKMPILRMQMMLHYASSVKPFAPEATRTGPAYTRHVKTLLRQSMIERPSKRERREHPGWSYRVTDRGRAYVHALRHVGLPELVSSETVWHVPS